jgi:Flp pilus assembly protein TadG
MHLKPSPADPRRVLAHLRALKRALVPDRSGLAVVEFALVAPIVLTAGLYSIELTSLALAQLKASQIALNLADNMSRMGITNGLSTQQVREVDVNDALEAVRDQGAGVSFTTYGRVTLSSLENQTGNQVIHWQRCVGLKSGTGYDSTYGTTTTTAGTDQTTANAGTAAASGMGDAGSMINAPVGAGVMFVEVNYSYRPMFAWLMSPSIVHYTSSFIVRDQRDFRQIYNPSPAVTRSTCDRHTV